MSLAEYLGMFEAASAPTQPSQSGLIKMGIGPLQRVLNSLGERLVTDGKYGPNTKAAWARQATKRNQVPAFDRASPTEAWVSSSTYTTLTRSTSAPSAAVAPLRPVTLSPARQAAAAAAAPAPSGTVGMGVNNLQTLLKSLGERLVADGKFGPATKAAWARQATKYGLSPAFDRVGPTQARIVLATYTALSSKAAMPPAVARAARITAAAAPTPAGTVQMGVSNLQRLLKSLGERLVVDGKFGPATKAAWARQAAKLRLSPAFDRVSPTQARIVSATYTALSAKAAMPPAARAAAVAPTRAPAVPAATVRATNRAGAVTKPVLELQQLLRKLGWRGNADGSYGPQTARAWAQYASARRLSPVISRIDGRTAKISANTFTALSAVTPAATQAPVVPPQPARLSAVASAYIKGSTVKVSTEVVQQALAQSVKIRKLAVAPPAITGVWGNETTALFLQILFAGNPNLQSFKEALPSLIAADGKSVKLMPVYADALATVSAQWLQHQRAASAQAPAPIASEPMPSGSGIVTAPTEAQPAQAQAREYAQTQAPEVVSGPTATSQPDASTYETGGGEGDGGGGGGGGAPYPEAPSQEAAPAPAASGDTWETLVNALANMTDVAPRFEAAAEDAKTQGPLHPAVVEVYAKWLASADALKSRIADMLVKSPELRAAVDSVGPSAGFSGYDGSELSAYLGQLEAASDRVMELLREPFAPLGLSGLENPALVTAGARVAALAARMGAPLWAKLLEILKLPVVQVAATGYMVKEAIGDAVNGETAEYLRHEQALAELVANGTLTVEQYETLKKPIPSPSSIMGPIVLGIVALGGLALYLRSRASS